MRSVRIPSLQTIGWILKEFPRYSIAVQNLAAIFFLVRSHLRIGIDNRLLDLTRAYSLAQGSELISLIAQTIRPFLHGGSRSESAPSSFWETRQIGWNFYSSQLKHSQSVSRTILLKKPGGGGEKGVILSCFEYNWLRILSGITPFEEFDSKYTLILSSSWSPTNYNILALALEKISGKVFVVPCNYGEVEKLKKFHPRIEPLDLLACDWLDPDQFEPKPWKDRSIDLVMVSNWAPFKRHWHFFSILSQLPPDLRVVCIGQPESGFTLDDIRELQERFQAPQSIEFLESIPVERVHEIQTNSKIAIILSRREGCCVAAVEGLMAGAYLVMLKGAQIGPIDYISENTGKVIRFSSAATSILNLLESNREPESHAWAKEAVSYLPTGKKLGDVLKEAALAENRPWTSDLVRVRWNPFPDFVDRNDHERLSSEAEILSEEHPLVFGENWLSGSRF